MSQFNYKDELSEGNCYYWRIPKGLPVSTEIVTMEFILQNKAWQYEAYYNFDNVFRITLNSISEDNDYSVAFNVRGGIIRDDLKEVVALEACTYKKDGKIYFIVGNLIPRSELYDIMWKNNDLYIFIEMKGENDEKGHFVHQIKDRTRKVETDFKDMLFSGKNSDVTIRVKRRKFMCHRCILSSRSPVFSAMMEHDMKEKATGVVTIKDAEPTAFQEFLLYLYTGNKKHLNFKNVTDLYTLGDKYDVEDLKSVCVKHMKENITMVNFYEFFLLSQQHNDSDLKDATVKFFLRYSKEIVKSNNWMTFLAKNLVECNVLITALANK